MPRSCTVGGGYYNRDTSGHKEQQSGKKGEVAAECEAEETGVELHEVAEPDASGLGDEHPSVLHLCQR